MKQLSTDQNPGHSLVRLPREDLDLIQELVLQSGSLKALAGSYGVSYPTIRTRLDRTIHRLKDIVQGATPDPMNELLAKLIARGELAPSAARDIRALAQALAGSQAGEQTHTDTESIFKGDMS